MASPGQAVVTQTEEIEACETKVVNSQTVVRKMNENTGRAAEHGQMQIHNDVLPWDVHTLMSAQSISLGALFDNMLLGKASTTAHSPGWFDILYMHVYRSYMFYYTRIMREACISSPDHHLAEHYFQCCEGH
jgi:hypothetical protein